MFENIFKHKKNIPEKLEAYGFQKINNVFQYSTSILDSEFLLQITIKKSIVPDTKLIEAATGEEYILYKTEAAGEFVGEIRMAVAEVLQDIADKCYETEIFKSKQALEVISYIRQKYGDELEFLWERLSDNAVWRRKDNDKWYGVLLSLPRRKLGIKSDEIVEIIDLKGEPEALKSLIDNKHYYPGWHMNKKHWYTIILDGSVSLDEICHRIDASYLLANSERQ
jgi:hypothetical protein